MHEALAFWTGLSSWQIGLALLPLGLVAGSFCTVIWHRVPRGESILWPRSHCPHCRQSLGVVDLVPVLSYLWLRGRCRHCGVAVPGRYLLTETGFGLAAGAAGWLGGWSLGFSTVACMIVGCSLLSLWRRRQLAPEGGFTLIEVAVAALVLTLGLVGSFEAIRLARWSGYAAQRRTEAIAMARYYLAQASYNVMNYTMPQTMNTEETHTDSSGDYTITTRYMRHSLIDNLWGVEITVACTSTCQGTKSPSGVEARLLGVVRR